MLFMVRITSHEYKCSFDFQVDLAQRAKTSSLNSHIIGFLVANEEMFDNVSILVCDVEAKRLTGMLHKYRARKTTS